MTAGMHELAVTSKALERIRSSVRVDWDQLRGRYTVRVHTRAGGWQPVPSMWGHSMCAALVALRNHLAGDEPIVGYAARVAAVAARPCDGACRQDLTAPASTVDEPKLDLEGIDQ